MTTLYGYVSNLAEELAENPEVYNMPMEPNTEDITWQFVGPVAAIGKKPLFNLINRGLNALYNRNRGLRDVNDGVKRTFLTRQEAEDYYNGLINKYDVNVEDNMTDYSNLTKQELKDMRQKWKFFAKDNYVGKDINIPNYPTSHFPNKNLGKDYLHNLEDYPDLLDNMQDSEYRFTTNFNNETDRLYDHMINEKKLVDYLMEVIQDNRGNISHSYKMMKNIGKGDKP